ncbi:MAG: anti-sigma factor family protein [Bacteroidia bacterium]
MSKNHKPPIGLFREDSPYSPEECEKILEQLEDFLDGTLPADQAQEVEKMVQACEYCSEQYSFEKRLREMLKKQAQRFSPIVNDILNKLRHKLRNTE